VPALLARCAPETRLMVIVRDPVERFRSGLDHVRRDRGALSAETYADAVGRGFYEEALRRWTEHFSPERILVLQYEHCVADPAGQLSRTYAFLGLEPFLPPGLAEGVNVTAKTDGLAEDVRRRLIEVYASDTDALSRRVPDVDLQWWPNFRDPSRS
jgi:hypothetical protein